MWTRRELKARAWNGLRNYYWYGLLACFISGILGAGVNVKTQFSIQTTREVYSGRVYQIIRDPKFLGTFLLVMSFCLVIFILCICFILFVSNVVAIGRCRYFSISTLTQQDAGCGELFHGFKSGRYLNIVKIQFFRGLYETLWGLLFVIPGIIKHYEYYMVPYLLAEYPEMEKEEVFHLSRQMMDGSKMKTFILELSFIGWYLLGTAACCIGIFFVIPYCEATFAELYLQLRQDCLGMPRDNQTNTEETIYP